MNENNLKALNIVKRLIRSLCDGYDFQSDCIVNDSAKVIHKILRQPGTFVIF